MPVERGDPAVCSGSNNTGGKGDMTKTPSSLQDLSESLYDKAKAEPTKRFWGLYVHVCKKETLQEAYRMAKKNNGAPGIDGVTFETIEESGEESFLQQIRDELITNTYRPMRARKKEIPKDGGKIRILSIPSIRDRVVQGALKLILEPIFEADFEGTVGRSVAPRFLQKMSPISAERLPVELAKRAEVITHLESLEDHAAVHSQEHYTGRPE
jgi:hypothetical protein